MAVPNTNTFSLQDVVNEVNPTTDDLQDCINDAVSSRYDSTYYTAPATSLLEFRNYNASAVPSVIANSGSYDAVNEEVDAFGEVTNDGGATILSRGFYYDIDNSNVTSSSASVSTSGTTGTFSIGIPVALQLTPTTFYYRAFAENIHGEVLSPTTISVSLPSNLKLKL